MHAASSSADVPSRPGTRHPLLARVGLAVSLAASWIAAQPAWASGTAADGWAGVAPSSAPSSAAIPRIPGVDPRVYLRARKPQPTATRDLAALPLEVSLTILREGPAAFLAELSAYPPSLTPPEVAALRAREARALTLGALAAVAAAGDALGPELALAALAPHLASSEVEVRAEAALRLGQTRAPAAVGRLEALAHGDGDPDVRAAACAGLGQHRSAEALAALEPLVLDGTDAERQATAVRALGALGSRWAWQARGTSPEGERLRARAQALVSRIEGSPGTLLERAVADAQRRLR